MLRHRGNAELKKFSPYKVIYWDGSRTGPYRKCEDGSLLPNVQSTWTRRDPNHLKGSLLEAGNLGNIVNFHQQLATFSHAPAIGGAPAGREFSNRASSICLSVAGHVCTIDSTFDGIIDLEEVLAS